jgi:hypothetical protein
MKVLRKALLLAGAAAVAGCSEQTFGPPTIELPLAADPPVLRLQVGEVASVRWLTRSGQSVQGLRIISENPSVAIVDSLGRVVARAVGEATVRPDSVPLLGQAHVFVLPRTE